MLSWLSLEIEYNTREESQKFHVAVNDNKTIIRVAGIIRESMNDGTGFRCVIFAQFCPHRCPYCHNPQTWDKDGGTEYTVDELFDIIVNEEFSDVTFSGGDPLFQVEGFTELAKMIKERTNKTIWCYTGYTYENIIKVPKLAQILPFIDVLVDGPYIHEKRDTSLRFRGSSNQRIIELKNGVAQNIT